MHEARAGSNGGLMGKEHPRRPVTGVRATGKGAAASVEHESTPEWVNVQANAQAEMEREM